MDRRSERLSTPPMPGKSGTVIDAKMSLGMFLRSGRANKGFSIADVAKITKIQPRILERLETGKLEGLPAEVFVRGFVKNFAKCVGLDEAEAIVRYAAALGNGPMPATMQTARAFVDSMQELAPSTASVLSPIVLVTPVPTLEAAPLERPELDDGVDELHVPIETELSPASPPEEHESVELAAGSLTQVAIAPEVTDVVDAAPSLEVAAPVVADGGGSKKKRNRRARGTQAGNGPKGNKRTAIATGTPAGASPVVVAPIETIEVIEVAPLVETLPTTDGAAADDLFGASTAMAIDVADLAVETASSEATAPAVVEAVEASPAIEASDATDAEPVVTQTWLPRMPTVTASSVPWRRPALGIYGRTTTPVVPSLVIDDSDPDSAERELEDRVTAKEPRTSFLPPILADRAKSAQGQGTLTLAVIILLIAATLTLSYLMRRPSSSGDGVTRADGTVELIG